jgi:cytosine/uracil/thiamine/allantoin permease
MSTTTVSGVSHTDGLIGVFMVGWFIGMITFFIMFLVVCSDNPTEIHSDKRIQPEKRLTTDGKTVDTLFIYKQER